MSFVARSFTRLALATFAISSAACGAKEETAAVDTTAVDVNAPLAVVSSGLATPEAVTWDATRKLWYVSNINGQPTNKDDNGYILRLSAEGQMMDSLPFITGADDDVTLNAPKGMALVGDTLWVSDIDAVRGFDVNSGRAVANIDLASMKATFLNDLVAGTDGTLYITDSGIAFDSTGAVLHPGKSRVFAISGRTASEAVVLPAQSAANGIAWDAARGAYLIVGFNSPTIFAWTPGSAKADSIGSGQGGGDGIVVLADGRALYSSWADSSISVFEGGIVTTLRKGLPSPADLGLDPARNVIAVPLFSADRVEFWAIPPKS